MNASDPHERTAREDCQVGEWIDADLVPEWSGLDGPREYLPERVTFSPEEGRLGGMTSEPSGNPWVFEPGSEENRRVWVRRR